MKAKMMQAAYVKKMVWICGWLLCAASPAVATPVEKEAETEADNSKVKVLVIGLHGNVDSNYFPESMIAEESGIPADSVSDAYNRMIAQNMLATNKDKRCLFVLLSQADETGTLLDGIRLQGEEEEKYADLSQVDNSRYGELLRKTGADYLLFLNQHYLKWQEKPLRTLFHITSYSVFDKNRKEVARGNNYFTSMSLEKREKLDKDSRKSAARIAGNVVRSLTR